MDGNLLVGVGGGLVFVIMALRELRAWRDTKPDKKNESTDLSKMAEQVNLLHQWHDKTDEDGVPVWYVRRSLEDSVQALSLNLDKLSKVLDKMLLLQQRTDERVHEKLDTLIGMKDKK